MFLSWIESEREKGEAQGASGGQVVLGPGLDLREGDELLDLAGVVELEAVAGQSLAGGAHVDHENASGHEFELDGGSGASGDDHWGALLMNIV